MSADTLSRKIIELLDADGMGMLSLLGQQPAYRIGDQYEHECIASALTISREHLHQVSRHEDTLRGVAYFAADQVPEAYRDRQDERGVVEIAIEVPLTDAVTLHVGERDGRWRAQLAG